MSRSSQQKGRRAEIELSDYLRQRGYDVRPGMAQSYGQEPDVVGLANLHLEVKRHERLELDQWMQQSIIDSQRFRDGAPCVVFRKNRQEWRICLRLSDFLQFYQKGDCTNDT